MFDLGWSEMMVVGVLALIIIGPKDLPRVFKQVSYWIKQLRGMAGEFQSGIDEMVKEADLDDAKKIFDKSKGFNPNAKFEDLIDPKGDLKKSLDIEGEIADTFSSDNDKLFEDLTAKTGQPVKTAPAKAAPKKTAAKKAVAKKPATPKKAAVKTTSTKTAATTKSKAPAKAPVKNLAKAKVAAKPKAVKSTKSAKTTS